MKKLFFCIILGMLFISCRTSKPAGENISEKDIAARLEGTWQLEMLFASDNQWGRTPFIKMNITDKTFSGHSGCNSINGRFTITGNYLGFDKNMVSTKMACADAKHNQNERTFLSALLKINKYSINKDELELGQGEIVLMKFKRASN